MIKTRTAAATAPINAMFRPPPSSLPPVQINRTSIVVYAVVTLQPQAD